MRRLGLFLTVLCILTGIALTSSCKGGRGEAMQVDVVNDSIPPLGFWEDNLDIVETNIRSGETFTGLFTRLGLSSDDAYTLHQRTDSIFDARKMRAGNKVTAYYHIDSTEFHDLHYVVYQANKTDMIVYQCTDSLAGWKVTKPVEIRKGYVDFTIHSSLWNDMKAAGASIILISDLSEVYAWTVDFFSLQEGDRFQALYSEKICEGEVISVDSIYYAVFSRDDKELPAIMYDQKDGGNLYWNDKGESLRKAFLKAPLKFTRISSGFSYARKHPVLGVTRPHTAIDYAAPTGTPVMSIGDGTVISAGYAGGGGNTVKIRHNSVYTTSYMHLSKYATGIKAGARVRQGDIIGYVGATGTATGPHLDFRVYKNGTAINPLTMDAPSEEPIKPENLHALDSVHVVYQRIIDSLAAIKPVSAVSVVGEDDEDTTEPEDN